MPSFAGFTLPHELRILREQIRRFIQEEIIPLEGQLDPDAPDIPDEDFARLSAKTKAAGLWAPRRSTAAAGSTRSACAWRSRRCPSTAWAFTTPAAASSAVCRRLPSG